MKDHITNTTTELPVNWNPELEREIAADFANTMRESEKQQSTEENPLPGTLSLSELSHKYPEAPQLLIAGWDDENPRDGALLACGGVMVLGSASKAGKTWMGIDLALAVATGGRWLNRFRCAQGKVLYINMELGGYTMVQRADMMIAKREIPAREVTENIRIHQLRNISSAAIEDIGKIIDEEEHDYSLIVLDPLYKLLAGREENNNGDMANLMSTIRATLTQDTKTAVCAIHHFPKGDMNKRGSIDRLAGAGALAREPDALVTITAAGDGFRLDATVRDFKAGPSLDLNLDFPTVNAVGPAEDTGPGVNARVSAELLREIIAENTGLNRSQLASKFMLENGCGKSAAYGKIKDAEKSKKIARTDIEKTYVCL